MMAVLLMWLPGCAKEDKGPVVPQVPDSVSDVDGHVYHPVVIGNQVWLRENLRATRYRNGDTIPMVMDSAGWRSTRADACCSYGNDSLNGVVYGLLYNWESMADSRKLCPAGWHVPSEYEWSVLAGFLGGTDVAGGKLKETGTVHWMEPNTAATNSSGFCALPAGYRNDEGVFGNITGSTVFWSSTVFDQDHGWYSYIYYSTSNLYSDHYHDKSHGFSIRCIRD